MKLLIPALLAFSLGCNQSRPQGRELIQRNADIMVMQYNSFEENRGSLWRLRINRCMGDTDDDGYGSCLIKLYMDCIGTEDEETIRECLLLRPELRTFQCSTAPDSGCKTTDAKSREIGTL